MGKRSPLCRIIFSTGAVFLLAGAVNAQPPAPTLIMPNNGDVVTYPIANFSWEPGINGTDSSYHLQVASDNGFSSILWDDSTLTGPTGMAYGFTASATYYWRVRVTVYGDTTSPWSSVWSFSAAGAWTFSDIVLTDPQDNAIGQMVEVLSLKWEPVAGVSTYQCQVATDSLFSASLRDLAIGGATPQAEITNLAVNTRYFWRVRATLLEGTVYPWSPVSRFRTQRFTTTGDLYWKRWRTHTMTFDGPVCSEKGSLNPFTDYRLIITFTQMESGGEVYKVPGYFAADGNAGETHDSIGNKWRVHFMNQWPGIFRWTVSFRYGPGIAASDDDSAGMPLDSIDGDSGTIKYRAIGDRLNGPVGDFPDFVCPTQGKVGYQPGGAIHYFMPADYANPILLLGASSPSNFLSYSEFDNTPNSTGYPRTWNAHVQDWSGVGLDATSTWGGIAQHGKGILGAINYLSFCNVQTISFSTLNINSGGDENVYPFADPDSLTRYDCSKLDQWQKVFDHAGHRGLFLGLKLQMPGNESLLGGSGDTLGVTRTVYCREFIARFAHNLAIGWHLGDNNTQATAQQRAMAKYFRTHDPFSIGNVTGPRATILGGLADSATFTPLLNDTSINATSLECGITDVHRLTQKWTYRSIQVGGPTNSFIVLDGAQSPAATGTPRDTGNEAYQDSIRKYVLWGNLMARGGGVSYSFGTDANYGDLTFQSFRSWSRMWMFNTIALRFFRNYLFPLGTLASLMCSADTFITNTECYCLASTRVHDFPEVTDTCDPFVVYLPNGGTTDIDLTGVDTVPLGQPPKPFLRVWWYNPRTGDTLVKGDSLRVGGVDFSATRWWSIGASPTTGEDWVALILPDTGNPTIGIKDRKPSAVNTAGFRMQSLTTRDGWIHLTMPKTVPGTSIEIMRIDGKVVATFARQPAGSRISYRCTSRGFYLLFSSSRGIRTVLAKILYL